MITCIKVMNQIDDDNEAAIPAFNSGGLGFNWVSDFVNDKQSWSQEKANKLKISTRVIPEKEQWR